MNIYEKLGLGTIINASDTYTAIGGSRMDPRVLEAMCEAAKCFVDINMLQKNIGERIATLTGNEAAYVTSGAAGGVVLSASACMTYEHPELINKLPDTTGLNKNEFLVFESQCGVINPYWHLIELSGAKLIKVKPSIEFLKAEICEKTAGIFYFAGTLYEENTPDIEKTVNIGRKYGIPVIVDAAAQLPPINNLSYYTCNLGADLVVFSGGKFIMGPQSSGLILGKKHLIEACRKNGSPNVFIGRPLKVGKEEIVALHTALEILIEEGDEKRLTRYNSYLDYIEHGLCCMPEIEFSRTNTGRLGQIIPMLLIRLPVGREKNDCHQYLRSLEPAIDIGLYTYDESSTVFVNPINLKEYELDYIVDGMKKYLIS